MKSARVTSGGVFLLFAVIGFAGCKSAPEPPTEASIENEVIAEATVQAIDEVTRQITLEGESGERFTVVAGPEVRNFDQIAVGDTVQARYVESLSVRRMSPDEPSIEPVAGVAAGRAEPGEMPAAGIAAGVMLDVTVESVDLEKHTVVFTDPAGRLRVVKAQRDEGRAFVSGLKAGDRVEMVFGEAVILMVE